MKCNLKLTVRNLNVSLNNLLLSSNKEKPIFFVINSHQLDVHKLNFTEKITLITHLQLKY